MLNLIFWLKVLAGIRTHLTCRRITLDCLFSIADFFDNANNILIFGLCVGIFGIFLIAGCMWIFNVPRRIGKWVVIISGITTVVIVEFLLWSFKHWWNTPLGEGLNLN